MFVQLTEMLISARPSRVTLTHSSSVKLNEIHCKFLLVGSMIANYFSVRSFGTKPLPKTNLAPFPGEPEAPSVKTAIPGPQSKKLSEELGKIQVSVAKIRVAFVFV